MSDSEQNKNDKYIAQIEALLFVYGEPMKYEKIVSILSAYNKTKLTKNDVVAICDQFGESLQQENRGLLLIRNENTVQLTTKPELAPLFESIIKDELTEGLTPAALETLAIIAYCGTVPRSTIDYIRGVNSTFIIRSLLMRGLIDRAPHPERKNAYVYTPSLELLKHVGVAKREELPQFEAFQQIVSKLKPEGAPTE